MVASCWMCIQSTGSCDTTRGLPGSAVGCMYVCTNAANSCSVWPCSAHVSGACSSRRPMLVAATSCSSSASLPRLLKISSRTETACCQTRADRLAWCNCNPSATPSHEESHSLYVPVVQDSMQSSTRAPDPLFAYISLDDCPWSVDKPLVRCNISILQLAHSSTNMK